MRWWAVAPGRSCLVAWWAVAPGRSCLVARWAVAPGRSCLVARWAVAPGRLYPIARWGCGGGPIGCAGGAGCWSVGWLVAASVVAGSCMRTSRVCHGNWKNGSPWCRWSSPAGCSARSVVWRANAPEHRAAAAVTHGCGVGPALSLRYSTRVSRARRADGRAGGPRRRWFARSRVGRLGGVGAGTGASSRNANARNQPPARRSAVERRNMEAANMCSHATGRSRRTDADLFWDLAGLSEMCGPSLQAILQVGDRA